MAPTRSQTPDPARLQRDTALQLGIGAVVLAVGAATYGQASGQALRTSLVALALFLMLGAVVLARVAAYHPFGAFGPANTVTTGRAILTCLFAGGLAQAGAPAQAWSLTAVAALSLTLDGVDGYLARRFGVSSRFGARYDMEVDAFLILLLSIAAWMFGKAGPWVMASGLIRYAFVFAAWRWPALGAELPPSLRRKLVCVVQTAALCLLLMPPVRPPLSVGIAAVALALLVWSFAVDLSWLVRRQARAGAA